MSLRGTRGVFMRKQINTQPYGIDKPYLTYYIVILFVLSVAPDIPFPNGYTDSAITERNFAERSRSGRVHCYLKGLLLKTICFS